MLGYIVARVIKKVRPTAVARSSIHRTSAIESGCQIVDVAMGRHSFCGYDCTILNAEIGSFCSIADQVYVGGSQHPMHFVSTSPVFLSHRDSVRTKFSRHEYRNMPRTLIGHDVWIGHGAKIRAGVSVGHGAVVGMGAIVTRDVDPYTIVGGNPARVIGRRFDEEMTGRLLETRWWAEPDAELRRLAVDFTDPATFLEKHGKG